MTDSMNEAIDLVTKELGGAEEIIAEHFGPPPPTVEPKCFRCGEAVYIDEESGMARHVKRGACEIPTISIEEASR